MPYRAFYAKLLLFGEYTIINDSSGLAIPLPNYVGKWDFSGTKKPFQDDLVRFHTYVATHKDLSAWFDVAAFEHDIKAGIYFDSTIPNGYGLGSSGAFCAAFFEKFVTKKRNNSKPNLDEILTLRRIFILLESFFHGSSSGIDPLICYLNQPILIKNKEDIVTTALPTIRNTEQLTIFLLNTHQPRSTAPLVNWFVEQCKEEAFYRKSLGLAEFTDTAVKALLSSDFQEVIRQVQNISTFQYENMKPMITEDFMPLWKRSIVSDVFTLKICGAGGGGFILGFTDKWEICQQELADYDLIEVVSF